MHKLQLCVAIILSILCGMKAAEAGVLIKTQPPVKASPASARLAARNSLVLKGGPVQAPYLKGGSPIQAPYYKTESPIQAPYVYCKAPCVRYKQHGTLRKTCCDCAGTYTTILQVEDPCTCCVYEIPVCVPDCCEGEPNVHGRLN